MDIKALRIVPILVVLSACFGCVTDNMMPVGDEEHVRVDAAQKDALFSALERHDIPDLYIGQQIPESKAANARRTCLVPQEEQILGLLDATVFGSAKNCLLFTEAGVYVRNDWAGDSPGRHYLPYGTFRTQPIRHNRMFEVSIGKVHFDISGCGASKASIAEMLLSVQQSLVASSSSSETGSEPAWTKPVSTHDGRPPDLQTSSGVPQIDPLSPKNGMAVTTQPAVGPVSKHWAVIVGISTYRDSRIPSLRYAAADAKAFHDWAVSPSGGRLAPAQTKVLLNEDATGENIKEALFDWLKQALAEDVVIIYYAGHGSPDTPDSSENLFLLPYDADYQRIATTGFPMWDIETALKRFVRARKVVVIADACHSGGVGESFDTARRSNRGMQVNAISNAFQGLSDVGDGVCVISASDSTQMSQEGEQWGGGHGVFTHFLLEGLKGEADYSRDDKVTLGELIPYLSEQVRRATRSAQAPTVAGKFDPALTIGR